MSTTSFQTTHKQDRDWSLANQNSKVPSQSSSALLKEFQTLKKINIILDSNPQTQEGKDQKIRSLIVMYREQLDINKNLEAKISHLQKTIEGQQTQLSLKDVQVQEYQKKLLEATENSLKIQSSNRSLQKQIQERNEELRLREELIEKMKDNMHNRKASMDSQLQYYKKTTLAMYDEKLKVSSQRQQQVDRVICSELKNFQQKRSLDSKKSSLSCKNYSSVVEKGKAKAKKQSRPASARKSENIIQRNILAISKASNKENSAQKMMQTFKNQVFLTERRNQIRSGLYGNVEFNKDFEFQL